MPDISEAGFVKAARSSRVRYSSLNLRLPAIICQSPWFNLFNEVAVEPFKREDALELLIEPVRDIYSYDVMAAEFILNASEGRPFRIQQYGLESVNHMLAAGRRRIIIDDVEAAHERIQSSVSTEYAHAGLYPHHVETQDPHGEPIGASNSSSGRYRAGEQDHGQWAGA